MIKPLSKGNRSGLVPVKRQVTKNGKTFMQTFYVKPDTTPDGPSSPTLAEDVAAPEREKSYYNLSDGFYVNYSHKAVKIPDDCIADTFSYRGYAFVIAQVVEGDPDNSVRFGADYRMYEASTGLGVGSRFDSPKRARSYGTSVLDQKSDEQLASAIAAGRKLSEFGPNEKVSDTDTASRETPKTFYSEEELAHELERFWEDFFDGEDGSVSLGQFQEWARDTEGVESDADIKSLWDSDEWVLERAVHEDMDYEDASTREEAITAIIDTLDNVEKFEGTHYDYEEISDWARIHENNLKGGIDWDFLGTSSDYDGIEWVPADVVAYAITNGVSLNDAQRAAEENTEEMEEEYRRAESEFEFTDSYGKDWDSDSLEPLKRWIQGEVKSTRYTAKGLYEKRRSGVAVNAYDYTSALEGEDIVAMAETHASVYEEGELYRGTSNLSWLESEVGTLVPYGMASFSKSEEKAKAFSTDVILHMEQQPDDPDNPIVGIDIPGLLDAASDAGFEQNLASVLTPGTMGMATDELEVIVMCPYLQVLRREDNHVWVKPVEVSLVEFMKALFDNRVQAMEATFDYPLHREPEGAFA